VIGGTLEGHVGNRGGESVRDIGLSKDRKKESNMKRGSTEEKARIKNYKVNRKGFAEEGI